MEGPRTSRYAEWRSEDVGERFHLYRGFYFARSPRLYVLRGPLRETCRLEPPCTGRHWAVKKAFRRGKANESYSEAGKELAVVN